jgi:hypothetical protein
MIKVKVVNEILLLILVFYVYNDFSPIFMSPPYLVHVFVLITKHRRAQASIYTVRTYSPILQQRFRLIQNLRLRVTFRNGMFA